MPRLNPYESQVRQNGTTSVQANESMFGGQSANAALHLGGQLDRTSDVVTQVDDAKSRFRAANYMAGADLDWRSQMITAQSDPEFAKKYGEDGSGFVDSFKQRFEQYASDQIQATDPRDRKYIEQGMYNLGESLMGSAIEFQAKVGADFAGNTLKKSIDNGAISARLSPDQYTSILGNATLAVSTAQNIDPMTRSKFAEAATKSITVGAALGRLEKGGVAAAQAIQSGKMTFAALDADGKPVQKTLAELTDPETFNMLSNQADVTIRKAQSEANQARTDMMSDINMQIERAETPDDFIKAEQMISSNASAFTHKELNGLRLKMYKQTKSSRDDIVSVDRGNAFGVGESYLNPAVAEDKKDFENYYSKRALPALDSMKDANERNTYKANIFDNVKMIPSEEKGRLQTIARGDNVEAIAEAADLIDRVRIKNPHLINEFDSKNLHRLDMVNQFMAANFKPEEAVNRVDALLNPNDSAVAQRREELKKMGPQGKGLNYTDMAVKNFSVPLLTKVMPGNSFNLEDVGSAPAKSQIATLTNEYKFLYETNFERAGNTDIAQKEADTRIRALYEVNDINGTNQLMRNGPRQLFSIPGTDDSWMREAMITKARVSLYSMPTTGKTGVGEVDTKVTPTGAMIRADTKPEDIFLVPVYGVTSRTAQAGTPLYKLQTLDASGLPVDILGPREYFTFTDEKAKLLSDKVTQARKTAQEKIDAEDKSRDLMGYPQ